MKKFSTSHRPKLTERRYIPLIRSLADVTSFCPRYLPQRAVDDNEIQMGASNQSMSGKRNSYVAIVDDDESICRSFGRLLRTAGFQPIGYPSAEAFLVDDRRPVFDCLLLDLQLPGISGLELSLRLAAVNDTTPVIFITAQDEPEESSVVKASGCAGYFRKTAPGSTIIQAIIQSIDQAVHCAELSPPHVDPSKPQKANPSSGVGGRR